MIILISSAGNMDHGEAGQKNVRECSFFERERIFSTRRKKDCAVLRLIGLSAMVGS